MVDYASTCVHQRKSPLKQILDIRNQQPEIRQSGMVPYKPSLSCVVLDFMMECNCNPAVPKIRRKTGEVVIFKVINNLL